MANIAAGERDNWLKAEIAARAAEVLLSPANSVPMDKVFDDLEARIKAKRNGYNDT